jgi:3-methyladenine DNA glycosylase AlkD
MSHVTGEGRNRADVVGAGGGGEILIPASSCEISRELSEISLAAGDRSGGGVIERLLMNTIVKQVRSLLLENADPATRDSGKRFFKEPNDVKLHGVKAAAVRKIAKALFCPLKTRSKDDVFALCEELWKGGYLEECGVACEWSYAVRKQYLPADLAIFETWLDRYVGNWAACDTLCNHSVGTLVEMYPELSKELSRWSKSDHRWLKRGAAVTLIIPARKGLFLDTVFAIADQLLTDPDDMVQKGYGWMLKAASEAHQQEVFAYLMAKKATIPRTAFRYALEKMPKELREKAMQPAGR